MDYAYALEYYEAITIIEAQDSLIEMNIIDYPRMTKEDRRRYHKEMYKRAYPQELKKEMEFDEFIRKMTGGR